MLRNSRLSREVVVRAIPWVGFLGTILLSSHISLVQPVYSETVDLGRPQQMDVTGVRENLYNQYTKIKQQIFAEHGALNPDGTVNKNAPGYQKAVKKIEPFQKKMMDSARGVDKARNNINQKIFKEAGVEPPKMTGTDPQKGRGIFGDAEGTARSPQDFQKIINTLEKNKIPFEQEGDYIHIKGSDTVIHRPASKFGETVGGSAHQAKVSAQTGGPETAGSASGQKKYQGVGDKMAANDAKGAALDSVKKMQDALNNKPETPWQQADQNQKIAKEANRINEAAGHPKDPILNKIKEGADPDLLPEVKQPVKDTALKQTKEAWPKIEETHNENMSKLNKAIENAKTPAEASNLKSQKIDMVSRHEGTLETIMEKDGGKALNEVKGTGKSSQIVNPQGEPISSKGGLSKGGGESPVITDAQGRPISSSGEPAKGPGKITQIVDSEGNPISSKGATSDVGPKKGGIKINLKPPEEGKIVTPEVPEKGPSGIGDTGSSKTPSSEPVGETKGTTGLGREDGLGKTGGQDMAKAPVGDEPPPSSGTKIGSRTEPSSSKGGTTTIEGEPIAGEGPVGQGKTLGGGKSTIEPVGGPKGSTASSEGAAAGSSEGGLLSKVGISELPPDAGGLRVGINTAGETGLKVLGGVGVVIGLADITQKTSEALGAYAGGDTKKAIEKGKEAATDTAVFGGTLAIAAVSPTAGAVMGVAGVGAISYVGTTYIMEHTETGKKISDGVSSGMLTTYEKGKETKEKVDDFIRGTILGRETNAQKAEKEKQQDVNKLASGGLSESKAKEFMDAKDKFEKGEITSDQFKQISNDIKKSKEGDRISSLKNSENQTGQNDPGGDKDPEGKKAGMDLAKNTNLTDSFHKGRTDKANKESQQVQGTAGSSQSEKNIASQTSDQKDQSQITAQGKLTEGAISQTVQESGQSQKIDQLEKTTSIGTILLGGLMGGLTSGVASGLDSALGTIGRGAGEQASISTGIKPKSPPVTSQDTTGTTQSKQEGQTSTISSPTIASTGVTGGLPPKTSGSSTGGTGPVKSSGTTVVNPKGGTSPPSSSGSPPSPPPPPPQVSNIPSSSGSNSVVCADAQKRLDTYRAALYAAQHPTKGKRDPNYEQQMSQRVAMLEKEAANACKSTSTQSPKVDCSAYRSSAENLTASYTSGSMSTSAYQSQMAVLRTKYKDCQEIATAPPKTSGTSTTSTQVAKASCGKAPLNVWHCHGYTGGCCTEGWHCEGKGCGGFDPKLSAATHDCMKKLGLIR